MYFTGKNVLWFHPQIGSKTRKPEFSIISGCLEGLCSSLVNFTESADEGNWQFIFCVSLFFRNVSMQ